MAESIKILFLASDPLRYEGSSLRLDKEARAVSTAIRMARGAKSFELVSEWAVRTGDLRSLILWHRPTIIHFSGHGSRSDGIYLSDDAGNEQAVNAEALRDLLSIFSESVRVVVLNASETFPTAQTISTVIDFTVGMDAQISDPAAAVFAEEFYGALASGMTVKEAFELGVSQLRLEFKHESKSPRLLVRDGVKSDLPLTQSDLPLTAAFPLPATPMRHARTSVFISYSHKDRRWLERLQVHLRPLERDHALEIWDDTKIRPGTTWRSEIQKAIANAKVAILVVSADFLASDFVASNELPPLLRAAKDEGAVILPVVVSPCRFGRSPLAEFQAVNDPEKPLNALKGANRERILTKVAEAVETALL